jgi:hypothetical protein
MGKTPKASSRQPERLISDKRIKSLISVVSKLLTRESSFQNRVKSIEEKRAAIEAENGTFIQANLALNKSRFTVISLDLKKLQDKIAAKRAILAKYVEINDRINGSRLGSAS